MALQLQPLDQLEPSQMRLLLAASVLVVGLFLGYAAGKLSKRILTAFELDAAVQGTAFERTVQEFGYTTVELLSRLTSWFIYVGAALAALQTAGGINVQSLLWGVVAGFLPQLFVAFVVLVLGFVIADKVDVQIRERLQGVKVPSVVILPKLVKFSIIFIAILVALSQIQIAVESLVIVLAVYLAAVVFLGGIASRDLLSSAAAGVYLLLNQPYSIGDEVEIGGNRGIVQEVDVLVTQIENDDTEFIIPNRKVFEHGVHRRRTE